MKSNAPYIPEPGEGKRGQAGHLGYLLRQANAAMRLAMDRALDDLGVTPPQFAVLTMLKAYPGASGADIARLALLTPQTVNVITRNLERMGAVGREPHPVHGRVIQLTMTDEGRALLARCRERVQKVEERLTSEFLPGEEEAVRRWLVAVATNL